MHHNRDLIFLLIAYTSRCPGEIVAKQNTYKRELKV